MEDLFTYCIENRIIQDSSEPSNDNTNIVNALQEPFVVNQDLGKNSSQSPLQINHHCCYGCDNPFKDIFCHQCTCELCGKGAHYGYNCSPKVSIIPDSKPFNNQTVDELPQTVPSFDSTCYSEDGNSFTYDSKSILVHDSLNVFDTPLQPLLYSCEFCRNDARYGHYCTPQEPDNSLSMGDEHLDTIPATKSDEFIKSSVENLVPNPSESEESLRNHDSSIISSSSKIDSLLDEFAGELTLLKSILSGINETDCDPEKEIRLIKRLLYDNSSPRPPEEFISENSDTAFESFSPFPIPVKDSNSLMEEIDLSFTLDDPMPPGIEEDDYDSERDILILEEFLRNDSLSLLENESFHFDIPSSSRPPAKPPDDNSGILNVKMMGDISEHKVKDIKEKDKIRAKTGQNQEQTGSVEKSKVKPEIENLSFSSSRLISKLRFDFPYSVSLGHDPDLVLQHWSRVCNKMFYLDMVRIEAVLKPPSDDEDTERLRKKSKNSTLMGLRDLPSHMD
nr:hypothetical protein [Tanacetum cinerariifolium]